MQDQSEDGVVFGLDGLADPEEAPTATTGASNRWRVVAACAGAVVVVGGGIATAVVTAGSSSSPEKAAVVSVSTSSPVSAPTSTTPAPSTTFAPKGPVPTPTLTAAELAAEKADLQKTAPQLTALRLSSPASWDKWLPQGKPYPGSSTAEEMSTCPTISSRLTAALGMKFSYWIGTLPQGPNGCDYATVPLSYDGPYTYPYTMQIGYLSGTTTEAWGQHFYEDQGAICPDIDAPAVAPGAILVHCVDQGISSYALVMPDSRRSDGVWFLEADARLAAPHPASYALTVLLSALKPIYG